MKSFVILIAALLLAPMAYAGKEKKPDPVKVARDNYRDSIKSYMEEKDKNKDGTVSKEEYIESEIDKEAAAKEFDAANKNGDRTLTKSEIAEMKGYDKALKAAIDDAKAKAKAKKNAKK